MSKLSAEKMLITCTLEAMGHYSQAPGSPATGMHHRPSLGPSERADLSVGYVVSVTACGTNTSWAGWKVTCGWT